MPNTASTTTSKRRSGSAVRTDAAPVAPPLKRGQRIGRRRRRRADEYADDLVSPPDQFGRHDEPVAAVVARPRDDADGRAAIAGQCVDPSSRAAAGARHQFAGLKTGLCVLLDRAQFRDGEKRGSHEGRLGSAATVVSVDRQPVEIDLRRHGLR